MRQLSGDCVPRGPFAAAAATPLVGIEHPAGKNRALGLEALAGGDEPELVEAAEGRQIGVGERMRALADGSVRHVEVFQMVSVRTSILGRPRPLSRYRHANARYTLNCEEPD